LKIADPILVVLVLLGIPRVMFSPAQPR